ncbi:MFS transporter small subunit [Deinococcus koreensis]|nr:hypothetical protein [Deinococcus koreensis]
MTQNPVTEVHQADKVSAATYLFWLVPGIPLAWGVWQTLLKVVQLFQ